MGIASNRASKYRDHRTINDVLAGLVDAQQRALADVYAAGIADVDTLLGPLDESVVSLSLSEAREQAWRVAVALSDFSFTPVEVGARWLLRTTAVGGATLILSPRLDPQVMQTLRDVERRDHDLVELLAHINDSLEDAY